MTSEQQELTNWVVRFAVAAGVGFGVAIGIALSWVADPAWAAFATALFIGIVTIIGALVFNDRLRDISSTEVEA